MNRREFFECTALLVGGVAASQIGLSLSSEQKIYLATAKNYTNQEATILTKSQKSALSTLCDIILPRTETPGASDAGVHRFIELIAAEWMNDDERKYFINELDQFVYKIEQKENLPFVKIDRDIISEGLVLLEEEAVKLGHYDSQHTIKHEFLSHRSFITQLKELTIWGFFTSEVGSTQVLRFDAMPMKFDGNIELNDDDSSWAMTEF